MKRKYAILLSIVGIEFLVVSILNKSNVKVESWIGNAIGTFIFFLPVQILLFSLSKDKELSTKKQVCCKCAFWFIIVCYFLGGIATLIQ